MVFLALTAAAGITFLALGARQPRSPISPTPSPSLRKRSVMHKTVKLALAATAAAIATAAGVTAASAAPAARPAASGTEYIQVMSASVAPGWRAPSPAVCSPRQARPGWARPRSARSRSRRDDRAEPPPGPKHVAVLPRRGRLSVISQSGSYRIVRGTGRYAGISGHGTYQLSLEIVAARANGRCSSARPPLGQQELLRLSGPVRRSPAPPAGARRQEIGGFREDQHPAGVEQDRADLRCLDGAAADC